VLRQHIIARNDLADTMLRKLALEELDNTSAGMVLSSTRRWRRKVISAMVAP
jgi:hypothetical protein